MKSSRERELQQLRAQGLAKKRSSYFDGSDRGQRSVPTSTEQDECISHSIAQQQQNGTKYLEGSKGNDDDGTGLGFLLSLSSESSDGSRLPSHEIESSDSIASPASSITNSSIIWHEVHVQNREMRVFQHQFRDILFGSVGVDEDENALPDQNQNTKDPSHDVGTKPLTNPSIKRRVSPKGIRKCLPTKQDPEGYESLASMDAPTDEEMMTSLAEKKEIGDSSGSSTDSLSSFEYASHDNSYFYRIMIKVKRWHRRRRKSQYQIMNAMSTEGASTTKQAKSDQECLTMEKERSTTEVKSYGKKSSKSMDAPEFFIPEKRTRSTLLHKQASIFCHHHGYQLLASVTMFLLLAAVVTCVVVLSKSAAETSPPSPLQSRRQVLRTMIELISGVDSLSNSTNPQCQAFEWMSTVDPTMLDSSPLAIAKTAERYVIALLYFATKGDEWIEQFGFLSPGPVCRWNDEGSEKIYRHGVVCDDNGNVLRIQLGDNNLVGTLPMELERLEYLELLHLPRNNITSSIPSHFDFPNLQHLDLKSNQISGSLPTELGLLQNIKYLNLGSNRLEGSIPSEIGNLSHLEFLSLDRNMLGNWVPREIGNLELAKTIDLSFNKLEGTVPATLGNLATLQVLRLQRNLFNGNLDTDFCSRDYISFTSDCLETESLTISCSCCDTCCNEALCCGPSGCRED